jgi:hypothetical protein
VPGFFAPLEKLSRRDLEALPQSLSTQKPKNIRLPYPAAWWIRLSDLQKSIRRGDVAQALDSAERLYREDPVKVRRRLAVVGVEDISYGDLLTTATAMTYAASAPKQASEEDLERCLALVERMASTVKDRIVAEAIGAATDSPKRRDSTLRIASASVRECAQLYEDEDTDARDRAVAGLALAGTLTVDGRRRGKRDREALTDSIRRMDVPDVVALIVECALKLGGEVPALAVILPILYRRMRSDAIKVVNAPLPAAPLIAGVLAPAFDRHTRAGLRALSKYRTHWTPLARFLRHHVGDPRSAIGTLAFRCEGSALNREVSCDLGDEIYVANEKAQAAALDVEYAALLEGKRLFLDGLPVLNAFRRDAAEGELRSLGVSRE